MPLITDVSTEYEENPQKYFLISIFDSFYFLYRTNPTISYDNCELMSYPAQKNILIPVENAFEIIGELQLSERNNPNSCALFKESFYCEIGTKTEDVIKHLEMLQKKDIEKFASRPSKEEQAELDRQAYETRKLAFINASKHKETRSLCSMM